MKKNVLIITGLALVSCFTACTQNLDKEYVKGQEQEIELRPMMLGGDVETKAIDSASGMNTTDYTLHVNAHHSSVGSYFRNALFGWQSSTFKGGTASSPNPKYWPLNGNLDLIAYNDFTTGGQTSSPSTSDCSSITVSCNSSASSQLDLCVGRADDATSGGLNMTFYHTKAKVKVAVVATSGAQYRDVGGTLYGLKINSITISGMNLDGTVTATGSSDAATWSSQSGAEDLTFSGGGAFNLSTSAQTFTNEYLVPEQSGNKTATVNYTLYSGTDASGNQISLNSTVTKTFDCILSDKEGKIVTYTFNFASLNEITINPSVTAWSTDGSTVSIP